MPRSPRAVLSVYPVPAHLLSSTTRDSSRGPAGDHRITSTLDPARPEFWNSIGYHGRFVSSPRSSSWCSVSPCHFAQLRGRFVELLRMLFMLPTFVERWWWASLVDILNGQLGWPTTSSAWSAFEKVPWMARPGSPSHRWRPSLAVDSLMMLSSWPGAPCDRALRGRRPRWRLARQAFWYLTAAGAACHAVPAVRALDAPRSWGCPSCSRRRPGAATNVVGLLIFGGLRESQIEYARAWP